MIINIPRDRILKIKYKLLCRDHIFHSLKLTLTDKLIKNPFVGTTQGSLVRNTPGHFELDSEKQCVVLGLGAEDSVASWI